VLLCFIKPILGPGNRHGPGGSSLTSQGGTNEGGTNHICLLDIDMEEAVCDGGATGCIRRRGSVIHTVCVCQGRHHAQCASDAVMRLDSTETSKYVAAHTDRSAQAVHSRRWQKMTVSRRQMPEPESTKQLLSWEVSICVHWR